jgi:hypothetical protein
MDEALKINKIILILIAGILFISSNSMPLANAQPTPTSLTIDVPSAPRGKECTIEATLKDENDNPLHNMDIDFYVCGTGCMDWIGAAKTDSNGVASLTYTFPRARTYNVTAIFSGTTNYVQSSSENVDIIIIDYTPYIVGGGLIAVAIIGVVGYIVFRRRKKATPIPKMAKEA